MRVAMAAGIVDGRKSDTSGELLAALLLYDVPVQLLYL